MTNNYAMKYIKKNSIINTEKGTAETAGTEKLLFESNKKEKEYYKNVNTRKEQYVKSIIDNCNDTFSRRYKLFVVLETAKKDLLTETAKEDSSKMKLAVYNKVIEETEAEIALFKEAEKEAENRYLINNRIFVDSMATFRTLDEKQQDIILRKSIRYQIKKANACGYIELDENGNSKEVGFKYYQLWVDENGFNSGMEIATNEMFILLSDNWKKYETDKTEHYTLKKKSTFTGYGNNTVVNRYETIVKLSYAQKIDTIVSERNAEIEKEEQETGIRKDRLTAFRVIAGTSAKNALQNVNYREFKHVKYMDRKNRIDTEAYNTTACNDWETAEKAIQEMYFNSVAQTETEKDVITLLKAGYTQNQIAMLLDFSTMAINRIYNRVKNRVAVDRMKIALDRVATVEMKHRKNENDNYILRCWIMAGIKSGLSYEKIAEYLHLEDKKNKKNEVVKTKKEQLLELLKDGDKIDITVKLNAQRIASVPFTGEYHKQTDKAYMKHYKRNNSNSVKELYKQLEQQEQERKQLLNQLEQEQEQERKQILKQREKEGYKTLTGTAKQEQEQKGNNNNIGMLYSVLKDLKRKQLRRERRETEYRLAIERTHKALMEAEKATA